MLWVYILLAFPAAEYKSNFAVFPITHSQEPLQPLYSCPFTPPRQNKSKREERQRRGQKKTGQYSFSYIPFDHKQSFTPIVLISLGGPGPPTSPSDISPSPTPSTLRALVPPADNHRPDVSSRNSKTAPVAPSLHRFLIAGALGCLHPQSLATRLCSFRIWGVQAWHSTKRRWRDSLLPLLHRRHSLDSLWRGPVILSCRKGLTAARPESGW